MALLLPWQAAVLSLGLFLVLLVLVVLIIPIRRRRLLRRISTVGTTATNTDNQVAAWSLVRVWEQLHPPSLSFGTSVTTSLVTTEPFHDSSFGYRLERIGELPDLDSYNPVFGAQNHEGFSPTAKSPAVELSGPQSISMESRGIGDGVQSEQGSSFRQQILALEQTLEIEGDSDSDSDSDSELRAFFGLEKRPHLTDDNEEITTDRPDNTLEHPSKAAMRYTTHEELPLKARDLDEERILNPTDYFASLDELEHKVLERSCLKHYLVREVLCTVHSKLSS
jgi:hypothetical protein